MKVKLGRARLELVTFNAPRRARLTRVALRNYRSIPECNVNLGEMTVLVGPNGSGKSNFLDGIQFVRDALRTTLESALRERGGVNGVRRHSKGHPRNVGFRLDLSLADGALARYAFEVTAGPLGTVKVKRELCHVQSSDKIHSFDRRGDEFREIVGAAPPAVTSNSLALTTLSGQPPFDSVFDAITNFGFYNVNPDAVRELQDPGPGDLLASDGSNLASVIRNIAGHHPDLFRRIISYLSAVVPGIKSVDAVVLGPKETLEFKQNVHGDDRPWTFGSSVASDGTVRALTVIVAALQPDSAFGPVSVVAIEEPEIAVHPGAAQRIMDVLLEASAERQIIITTHSPDLLDHPSLSADWILAVQADEGRTAIGSIDEATKEAVQENLFNGRGSTQA